MAEPISAEAQLLINTLCRLHPEWQSRIESVYRIGRADGKLQLLERVERLKAPQQNSEKAKSP